MTLELAIAQLATYVALTVTGLTVAVVSLIFSYRHNFGWRPIILPVGRDLKETGGENIYWIGFEFEVWNRRTYPVVIRRASVKFNNLRFLDESRRGKKSLAWHIQGGEGYYYFEVTVPPKEHTRFVFEAPFEAESLDALRSDVKVEALLFDPHRNSLDTLSFKDIYRLNE